MSIFVVFRECVFSCFYPINITGNFLTSEIKNSHYMMPFAIIDGGGATCGFLIAILRSSNGISY